MVPQIETKRLLLRPFEPQDLNAFHVYASDPMVGTYAGWKPHENLIETATVLKEFIERYEAWAITEKGSDQMIGTVGMTWDTKRYFEQARVIGYGILPAYWGKGYMTEAVKPVIAYAFEQMGLTLLSVDHYTFNERSKRVIEKCGFLLEGVLRRAALSHDGNFFDVVCYSMTKEEYFQQKVLHT